MNDETTKDEEEVKKKEENGNFQMSKSFLHLLDYDEE